MTPRKASLAIGLLAALASGPAIARTYHCKLDPPQALVRNGDQMALRKIGFAKLTPDALAFTVAIAPGEKKGPATAKVTWPGDPIQLAGIFPVLPTAKGSFAFNAFSMGPCMFTDMACMAMVQLVDQPDQSARVLILPSAVQGDGETGKREPFVAFIEGACTRDNAG
jgi:hypothetical protein